MDSRLWHPNEQLLLRAAVRFKKHDGTLFVTPQRVAWQQQGSSQLTPSIYYNDILGKSLFEYDLMLYLLTFFFFLFK